MKISIFNTLLIKHLNRVRTKNDIRFICLNNYLKSGKFYGFRNNGFSLKPGASFKSS